MPDEPGRGGGRERADDIARGSTVSCARDQARPNGDGHRILRAQRVGNQARAPRVRTRRPEFATGRRYGLAVTRMRPLPRFAPALELRTDGSITYEEAMTFARDCTDMFQSYESIIALCDASVSEQPLDVIVAQWQAEYLEHCGLSAAFAAACFQPNSVYSIISIPLDDQEHWHAFMHAVVQLRKASVSLITGALQLKPWRCRRLTPSHSLKMTGSATREELVRYLNKAVGLLQSPETLDLLRRCQAAGDDMRRCVVRWQHEALEWAGLERHHGFAQVNAIITRYAADKALCAALRTMQAAKRELFIQACLPNVRAAAMASERRFPAATTLQTEGIIDVSVVERLGQLFGNAIDSEAFGATVRRRGEAPSIVAVRWQRELLEHLGVEQDWGVRALGQMALHNAATPAARNERLTVALSTLHAEIARVERVAQGEAPSLATSDAASNGLALNRDATTIDPIIPGLKTSRPVRPGSARARTLPDWKPLLSARGSPTSTPRSELSISSRARPPLRTSREPLVRRFQDTHLKLLSHGDARGA